MIACTIPSNTVSLNQSKSSNDTDTESLSTLSPSDCSGTEECSQSTKKIKVFHRASHEDRYVIILGMLLSCNSGFNNGVTLTGFLTPFGNGFDQESTGGTTSTITKSALALADNSQQVFGEPHWVYFGFQISMIVSFMLGGVIASILNPRPVAWRLSPTYVPSFGIGSLMMIAAAIVAHHEDSIHSQYVHYYFLIACANGLANALSSIYSGNLIRYVRVNTV